MRVITFLMRIAKIVEIVFMMLVIIYQTKRGFIFVFFNNCWPFLSQGTKCILLAVQACMEVFHTFSSSRDEIPSRSAYRAA